MHQQESPILRGVTFSHFDSGNNSHLFRKQYQRSLSQIDQLLAYQEKLRKQLGEEKANQIQANPDLFYNHEKFRIMQAKARFRAILYTLVAVPVVSVLVAGRQNGRAWLRSTPLNGLALTGVVFGSAFFVFHRIVGYNSEVQSEQAFAKNEKMLRNLIIKA